MEAEKDCDVEEEEEGREERDCCYWYADWHVVGTVPTYVLFSLAH